MGPTSYGVVGFRVWGFEVWSLYAPSCVKQLLSAHEGGDMHVYVSNSNSNLQTGVEIMNDVRGFAFPIAKT